jgi:LuxR family maltose regulon positive regulatory protein
LVYQGKAIEMFELLESIKSLLITEKKMSGNLFGEYNTLSTWHTYNVHLDYEKCIVEAEQALSHLDPDNLYPAGIAWVFWGGALQCLGRAGEAISSIYKQLDKKPSDLVKSMLLLILNYIYWLEGDIVNLQASADHLVEIGKKQPHNEAYVNGLYFAGVAYYHQNSLDMALEMLEKAYVYRFHTIGIHHVNIISALTWVYLETGRSESVKNLITNFSDFAVDKGNPYFMLLRETLEADVNFRLGNMATAQQWAEKTENLPLYPFSNILIPQLILIKILIYVETTISRNRARTLLEELETYLLKSNNKCFLLEIYAQQAILQFDLGNQELAFKKLQQAVNLAEPAGFVRVFVDLGAKMAVLLKGLADQNISIRYIGKLLRAFRQQELQVSPEMSMPGTDHPKPAARPPIQYSLTNREQEILEFLKQRQSNKEIAQKLFLAPETIKKHTKNIYQKLNVNSRQEAVEKAEALDLLKSSS